MTETKIIPIKRLLPPLIFKALAFGEWFWLSDALCVKIEDHRCLSVNTGALWAINDEDYVKKVNQVEITVEDA